MVLALLGDRFRRDDIGSSGMSKNTEFYSVAPALVNTPCFKIHCEVMCIFFLMTYIDEG